MNVKKHENPATCYPLFLSIDTLIYCIRHTLLTLYCTKVNHPVIFMFKNTNKIHIQILYCPCSSPSVSNPNYYSLHVLLVMHKIHVQRKI